MQPSHTSMSIKNKANSALERLNLLEKSLEDVKNGTLHMGSSINKVFQDMTEALNSLREEVAATTSLVGVDAVRSAVLAAREERNKKAVEELKEKLQSLVNSGDLVITDKVGENSIIAGREVKSDGTPIAPGFAALYMSQIAKQEHKDALLNQQVGFVLTTSEGGTFTVDAIYNQLEKPESSPKESTTAA